MARRLRGDLGGIAGLRELIAQHKEAIEYDLIGLGLRLDQLGTRALSWRDLLVIVNQSPRTSALRRSVVGEQADWGLLEHLTAANFDTLQQLVWLQSADGPKNRNRPKPMARPGVEPAVDEKKFGSNPQSIDDTAAWLQKRNPHQAHETP